MLVTALEAMADVPAMEVVTERLVHEERKLKDRDSFEGREEAINGYRRGQGVITVGNLAISSGTVGNVRKRRRATRMERSSRRRTRWG